MIVNSWVNYEDDEYIRIVTSIHDDTTDNIKIMIVKKSTTNDNKNPNKRAKSEYPDSPLVFEDNMEDMTFTDLIPSPKKNIKEGFMFGGMFIPQPKKILNRMHSLL